MAIPCDIISPTRWSDRGQDSGWIPFQGACACVSPPPTNCSVHHPEGSRPNFVWPVKSQNVPGLRQISWFTQLVIHIQHWAQFFSKLIDRTTAVACNVKGTWRGCLETARTNEIQSLDLTQLLQHCSIVDPDLRTPYGALNTFLLFDKQYSITNMGGETASRVLTSK